MNKQMILILGAVAVVLLYLFSKRSSVPSSSAPVGQPGAGAGGVQFAAPDPTTGLPIFYKSLNPPNYVGGRASVVGGFYTCGSGMIPALNGEDGAVYCVIPANATAQAPIAAATAATDTPFAPQGPTPSGGYLGAPTAIGVIDYQAPSLGAGAPAASVEPDLTNSDAVLWAGSGAGTDPLTSFFG